MPRAMLNVNELNNPNPPVQATVAPVDEQAPAAPVVPAAPAAPAAPPVIARSAARAAEEKAAAPAEEDPQAKYASAFPAWDLTPPQVLIRRVSRKK